MSLDIEKQSLATLREWAGLLGLKGVSALRKGELAGLLGQVGEARIEKALALKAEKAEEPAAEPQADPEQTVVEAAPAEEAAEPEKSAEEAAPEKPRSRWTSMSGSFNRSGDSMRDRGRRPAPARPMRPRPAGPAASERRPLPESPERRLLPEIPEDKKGEAPENSYLSLEQPLKAPINDAPADNSEISEPEEGSAARPRRRYNNPFSDNTSRYTNRGGFGTYAPSYRAQTEDRDEADKPEPVRDPGSSAGRSFSSRTRESVPAEELPESPRSVKPEKTRREDFERLISDELNKPEEFETEYLPEEPREDYREEPRNEGRRSQNTEQKDTMPNVPTGDDAHGILEVMPDGYGFIRCENYMPGENDVYVAPSQIHRFGMKTGDVISGVTKARTGNEKFAALLYITEINDEAPAAAMKRKHFEDLTPVFPNERIHLETEPEARAMRIMDLMAPIGKGQRGMVVSPPKAGKTTLIKEVAKATTRNHPDMHLIILLIDERPEEVTDIKECIEGPSVEVIYSTFDETPEHHKRVAEMVLGRAQRLVEHGRDVMILLDSITRLARAYNLTCVPSGRTLSGGLDPAALHMPKKFFGAARNMREGGSLTILATALVDTGSRLDDMVYEEFKGTGNMELVLDRKLSERRIFPAIDLLKSGTRRDDLLLSEEEQESVAMIRQAINSQLKGEESVEKILDLMRHTKTNREFCALVRKIRF